MKLIQTAIICLILGLPNLSFASAPPVPGSCSDSSSFLSADTPVAIDAGAPSVITSTITVSGMDSYLWDLDLTTNVTHTFAADLDVTLTSPAGTVVTITTDNGAGNDDVFNGTLWDDSANPAGQVPYVTNPGIVSDHPYVNLTLASPLVPEESMAAFAGEDPNGIWTLTISDDLTGDGGSLDSWSLAVVTLPSVVNSVSSTDASISVPVNIPTGPAVVSDTLNVSSTGIICDVDLDMNLTHTFGADLDITLASPAGTVVTLTTDNGAGNDNTFAGTLWDDFANPGGLVPYTTNNGLVTDHAYVNLTPATPLVSEESLGAFIGENQNGVWTLTISDDLAGDGGTLNSWSLTVTNCTQNDADSDGTVDGCDQCPSDAGKIIPGVCGCGTADVDTDGDAVLDCNETCPTDAAKTAPGVCGCGVSDADTNSNGTPDCNDLVVLDLCPADPGKASPGTCGCGVADVDLNANQILDCLPRDIVYQEASELNLNIADLSVRDDLTDIIAALKDLIKTINGQGITSLDDVLGKLRRTIVRLKFLSEQPGARRKFKKIKTKAESYLQELKSKLQIS